MNEIEEPETLTLEELEKMSGGTQEEPNNDRNRRKTNLQDLCSCGMPKHEHAFEGACNLDS